jgi:hypothetical protein
VPRHFPGVVSCHHRLLSGPFNTFELSMYKRPGSEHEQEITALVWQPADGVDTSVYPEKHRARRHVSCGQHRVSGTGPVSEPPASDVATASCGACVQYMTRGAAQLFRSGHFTRCSLANSAGRSRWLQSAYVPPAADPSRVDARRIPGCTATQARADAGASRSCARRAVIPARAARSSTRQ